MAKHAILWILGRREEATTGVSRYSTLFITELMKQKGIVIHEFWLPSCSGFLYFFYRFLILPTQILFVSHKYDYIVLKDHSYSYLVPFIRCKSIIIVHHLMSDEPVFESDTQKVRKISDGLLSIAANEKTTIVAVSSQTRQSLINKYKKFRDLGIYVIGNPINFNVKDNLLINKEDLFLKFDIPSGYNYYLLYVGSEESRKNFKVLLHVLKGLNNKNERYFLIKIGKPVSLKNRQEHLMLINQLNLDNIKIIDYVENEDLIRFYKSADIFLSSSLYEGFGRTPLEAQFLGTPVISTSPAALQEVLQNSAIMISKPNDIDSWILAIEELKDLKLRNIVIEKGLINASEYNITKIVSKWNVIFGS